MIYEWLIDWSIGGGSVFLQLLACKRDDGGKIVRRGAYLVQLNLNNEET